MRGLNKIIIVSIGGLSLSLLLILFLIKPVLSGVTELNSQVRQKKTELAVLDQQIRAFKNAQADLAKAVNKESVNNAVVIKENLVLAVEDLEAAAAKSGVEYQILQIKESTEPKDEKPVPVIVGKTNIDEVPYQLQLAGDFPAVLNFFGYIEHLPHFTEIKKIDLSAESSPGVNNALVRTGRALVNIQAVFFIKHAAN